MIISLALSLLFAAGNPLDPPEISTPVKIVALGMLGLLGAGIAILTFAKLWMDVMGKRSSATVSIQAHSESDSKDKESSSGKGPTIDISGFVAAKDFDAHKEEARLRAVGLEKQISESRHDWQRELQAVLTAAEDRDEASSEWRRTIGTDVKSTALKLAAVEKQADMIQATQQNMDQKLDRLVEKHIPSAK